MKISPTSVQFYRTKKQNNQPTFNAKFSERSYEKIFNETEGSAEERFSETNKIVSKISNFGDDNTVIELIRSSEPNNKKRIDANIRLWDFDLETLNTSRTNNLHYDFKISDSKIPSFSYISAANSITKEQVENGEKQILPQYKSLVEKTLSNIEESANALQRVMSTYQKFIVAISTRKASPEVVEEIKHLFKQKISELKLKV